MEREFVKTTERPISKCFWPTEYKWVSIQSDFFRSVVRVYIYFVAQFFCGFFQSLSLFYRKNIQQHIQPEALNSIYAFFPYSCRCFMSAIHLSPILVLFTRFILYSFSIYSRFYSLSLILLPVALFVYFLALLPVLPHIASMNFPPPLSHRSLSVFCASKALFLFLQNSSQNYGIRPWKQVCACACVCAFLAT